MMQFAPRSAQATRTTYTSGCSGAQARIVVPWPGAAVHGERAADGIEAVLEAAQARAARHARAADAVVGDLGHERAVLDLDRDRRLGRLRVLRHVGERLGDGEVDRRLDRGRGALGRDAHVDGERAAGDEAVERGAEPVLAEHRRMDPVGEVAQLGQPLAQLLGGLGEDLLGGRALAPAPRRA